MECDQTNDPQEEIGGIQIDKYGVKARITPVESAESDPKTWKEVGQRVNRLLMSICVEPLRFVVSLFKGATGLLDGIRELGKMPAALNKRIENAHRAADESEGKNQQKLELGERPRSAEDALAFLQEKFAELVERGLHIENDERFPLGIIIVHQDKVEDAKLLLDEMQKNGARLESEVILTTEVFQVDSPIHRGEEPQQPNNAV